METSQSNPSPQPNAAGNSRKIRIKYEELSAKYANQVVLNGSADEIYLDFSSGPVPDPQSGESMIPIHTRIAMSHGAARRLLAALQQTLMRVQPKAKTKSES